MIMNGKWMALGGVTRALAHDGVVLVGFQRVAGHELVPAVDKQCNIYRANPFLEYEAL